MKTVRLITCNDSFQAHLIQGALKNEGIDSILQNDNTSGVLRGYISPISGVDIFVAEEQYEEAFALLERNQMIGEQLKYCPYCHSDQIKFVLNQAHRTRAIFAAILGLLSGAPPGTEHWEYICKKCGKHFDRPVSRKSNNDNRESSSESL